MEESKPKLTMFIDKADVYEDDYLVATFKMFDGDSYTMTVNEKIVTPDNLRELADILEKLEERLKE
jgi:hypothetical protein